MELLTAAQMRAIEGAAIDSGAVTGLELMERAGRGVVEAIFAEWPELQAAPHRAVVLCGPGNNGGDGFVIARLLKEWGWEVELFLYGDPDKLPPDAKVNYERWAEMGAIRDMDADAFEGLESVDLVIDAIFGAGLTRPFPEGAGEDMEEGLGRLSMICRGMTEPPVPHPPKIVAVDVPSGLCSDSGRVLSTNDRREADILQADLTVTFHRPRVGHRIGGGPAWCGQVRVADIGLDPPGNLPLHERVSEVRLTRADAAALDKGLAQNWGAREGLHKYNHGHVLVLAGGAGKGGAARLAARAALRVGAGLVTLGCPAEALAENAARLDAVMTAVIETPKHLTDFLKTRRVNAILIGPGLGLDARGKALVKAVLTHPKHTLGTLLDADALTHVTDTPALRKDLYDAVLTPHFGEFARLFPDLADRLDDASKTGPAYSRVDATRAAAGESEAVVLLKGVDTVIADRRGAVSVHAAVEDRAVPWLATAGSGDVLAGLIIGLMARGFGARKAAEMGAWLHVEAARAFGPGLIAEDLPETLPKVFRALAAGDAPSHTP